MFPNFISGRPNIPNICMTSLWLIWLMKPWIWLIKIENSLCGSKSLTISLQIVWNMHKNISKNWKGKLLLPEIMGDLVGPEMKNFSTGSRKIFYSKDCKKLFNESYSRFSISRNRTAVKVFEVLSVAMTSSPEVVGTENISSILGFQDPLNSVLNSVLSWGLRAFASLGRIDALPQTPSAVGEDRPASNWPFQHNNPILPPIISNTNIRH